MGKMYKTKKAKKAYLFNSLEIRDIREILRDIPLRLSERISSPDSGAPWSALIRI